MSEFINNASKRKDALKAIIRKLHAGESVESLQEEFNEIIAEATASDIAQAEREVIAEGLPVADIQKLCDLHVAVFQQGLESQAAPESVPGHPVHNFRLENEIIGRVLESVEGSLARVLAGDKDALKSLRMTVGNLQLIERHYEWKENLLFPVLEKYGFEGPSKVMWGVHNDIRKAIRNLQALINSDSLDLETIDAEYLDLAKAVRDMFYKEEKVLLPESLTRLSQEDWDLIKSESLSLKKGAESTELISEEPAPALETEGKIPLSTGALTQEQINLMLSNLPVDITFVDENDKVCFFSQTSERIFVRTAAIIGRAVQNCHPPQSVHVVQHIVDDFRAGKRDVAEFWIQMGPKFVHIRYFALRDAQGAYKGVIEVTQDVSSIRALEGERRLLDD
ncbi:MAG TPA: DUF438 domain-containing protein [Anaerolineaceae bacterium]|nr:DUF438 domain-containing protein [Anaerolineaceae bacterium]HOA22163.1 DUF438 domain-containing protein [Anaerolineaceae bacterium]